MATPLLQTKLYVPPARPELVPRPHLIERLNAGLRRKLTLISAPAGFGKTTLVSASIQQCEQPVAWLSLDEGDNDPARFLVYFIAALQTLALRPPPSISRGQVEGIDARQVPAGNIGEESLGMLQSPQPLPTESVLTILINEIAAVPDGFVLILDDYHLIEAQPVHEALTFLLAHLPPQMHLVIISRSDPFFLPLSRLRARGQMIELRADDLRFSPRETATFLNQVMGLALSSGQVATLETRTEGWIAGLQLAALSLQGQEDAAGLISAFAADDRYIADYLVDEVLARRPKGTKDFLLQTSILDRMTGPLCDAVTGQEEGQEVLQRLERANLFIVPLDNRRRWYRYHHLFADLLRQRLQESSPPKAIESLHRRASQWYQQSAFLIEAVEHKLAAGDFEDVIRLIREGAAELFTRSQMNVLLRWWAKLPQELVVSQPEFCMTYAWAWVATGHPEEAERCLQAVEQALGTEMPNLYVQGEKEQGMDPAIRGSLVEVAVVRAQLAISRGDITEAFKLTRLVLPYLKDDEGPYLHNPPLDSRTIVLFIMGLAHKLRGELGAADEAFTKAGVLAQERSNVHIVAGTFGHQAGAQTMQGHLRQAVQTCQRGLQLVQEMVGERSPISGLMHVELGNLLYKQNDLEAALHHLEEGIAVAKPWSHWDTLVPGYTGLARARVAQGDRGGAFATLNEVAALGKNNPQAVMPAVESFRAMLWAAQGKVDEARRWAQTVGLAVDSEISFVREDELIILARVLMARKQWNEAARLIDRLLGATEAGKRWGRVIEVLVLRALVLNAQGKQDDALEPLAQALALAEPEGYVRIFVDEGEPMAALLRRATSRGMAATPRVAQGYVAELLAAFGDATMDEGRKTELFPSSSVLGHSSLVEPLSERELEVLRLLKTELSGPEIAHELVIALSTMRTHTQSVYSKLNVNNRRAAVKRSEELNLI